MRKFATIMALVALVTSGNLLVPNAAGAAVVGVGVGDSAFDPATITVVVGDTVTWTVASTMPHTVTADGGAFDSGTITDGATFSFTFDTPGSYPYYCFFHGGPGGVGMSGVVVVEPAGTDPTNPPDANPSQEPSGPDGVQGEAGTSPSTSMPRGGVPQAGTSSPLYTG